MQLDYNVINIRAWILVDLQIKIRRSFIQLLLKILEFTIGVYSEDYCCVLNVHAGQFTNSVTIMGPSQTLINCKSNITILEFLHVCWLRDDRPQGFWFDLHKDMIAPMKEILIMLLTAPNYWKFRSQFTNHLLWGKTSCPGRMCNKICMISGFRHKVDEICAILDYFLLNNPHEVNSEQNIQFMANLKSSKIGQWFFLLTIPPVSVCNHVFRPSVITLCHTVLSDLKSS